jgi:hypothetical protein
MYIEVMKKGKSFWVRLRSANHRVRYTSETYYSIGNARRVARQDGKELNLKVIDRTK